MSVSCGTAAGTLKNLKKKWISGTLVELANAAGYVKNIPAST